MEGYEDKNRRPEEEEIGRARSVEREVMNGKPRGSRRTWNYVQNRREGGKSWNE